MCPMGFLQGNWSFPAAGSYRFELIIACTPRLRPPANIPGYNISAISWLLLFVVASIIEEFVSKLGEQLCEGVFVGAGWRVRLDVWRVATNGWFCCVVCIGCAKLWLTVCKGSAPMGVSTDACGPGQVVGGSPAMAGSPLAGCVLWWLSSSQLERCMGHPRQGFYLHPRSPHLTLSCARRCRISVNGASPRNHFTKTNIKLGARGLQYI